MPAHGRLEADVLLQLAGERADESVFLDLMTIRLPARARTRAFPAVRGHVNACGIGVGVASTALIVGNGVAASASSSPRCTATAWNRPASRPGVPHDTADRSSWAHEHTRRRWRASSNSQGRQPRGQQSRHGTVNGLPVFRCTRPMLMESQSHVILRPITSHALSRTSATAGVILRPRRHRPRRRTPPAKRRCSSSRQRSRSRGSAYAGQAVKIRRHPARAI